MYVCNNTGVWYLDIGTETIEIWNLAPLWLKLLIIIAIGVIAYLYVLKKYRIAAIGTVIPVIVYILFALEVLGDCWV